MIRNFPHSFSHDEIHEFVQLFDPTEIDIYHNERTAFAVFATVEHTRNILQILHQEQIEGYRLFVEFSVKHKERSTLLRSSVSAHFDDDRMPVERQPSINVNDAIKRLYATAENVDVSQPPPPYLYYEYPTANRSIIDAISIALESTPHFYVQVLHLMNRMNMEPPFVANDKRLSYESARRQTQCTATQTDEMQWRRTCRNKRKLLASDESELDSSSESGSNDGNNGSVADVRLKRPKERRLSYSKSDLIKIRQRQMLKMQRLQIDLQASDKAADSVVSRSTTDMESTFERSAELKRETHIKIIAPDKLDVLDDTNSDTVATEADKTRLDTSCVPQHSLAVEPHRPDDSNVTANISASILSDAELQENRIPSEQLQQHPLFQNYSAGAISNRLYIKNIGKDVTVDDLHAIYDRYLETNCNGDGAIRSIDVRLMTSGRMKGQAFVTFDGPYLNCDVDEELTSDLAHKYWMVERAIRETNGFILKGKPLVVQYGKSK